MGLMRLSGENEMISKCYTTWLFEDYCTFAKIQKHLESRITIGTLNGERSHRQRAKHNMLVDDTALLRPKMTLTAIISSWIWHREHCDDNHDLVPDRLAIDWILTSLLTVEHDQIQRHGVVRGIQLLIRNDVASRCKRWAAGTRGESTCKLLDTTRTSTLTTTSTICSPLPLYNTLYTFLHTVKHVVSRWQYCELSRDSFLVSRGMISILPRLWYFARKITTMSVFGEISWLCSTYTRFWRSVWSF